MMRSCVPPGERSNLGWCAASLLTPQDAFGLGRNLVECSSGHPLQAAAFTLRQAAPDPEPLVALERVFQAVRADLAAPADLLGLPRAAALLGEEGFRIRLGAERAVLPAGLLPLVIHVVCGGEAEDAGGQ